MIRDVCLIIPVFNPDEELFFKFVEQAVENFSNIIIINDGSKQDCDSIFSKIGLQFNKIRILNHSVNLGKGRALKTAFNEYLCKCSDCIGIVQADCDGQHDIEDVVKCAKELYRNKDSLILGVRDFSDKNVPNKSKFGNQITRIIFRLFIGINIKDTQTGLRSMGNNLVKKFISTSGERYEYETNVLIECKEHNIGIKEIPIKTIYINKNQTSKFNPIKDSVAIYRLFGKYIFSSISAFVIDIILFNIFVAVFLNFNVENRIIYSTIVARIISSVYNFRINAKVVFKNMNKNAFIKYIVLVLVQMFVSAFSVEILSDKIMINVTIVKVIVDLIIFMVNFVVQREVIFKRK